MRDIEVAPSDIDTCLKKNWLHAVPRSPGTHSFCGIKVGRSTKIDSPSENKKCPMCLALAKYR